MRRMAWASVSRERLAGRRSAVAAQVGGAAASVMAGVEANVNDAPAPSMPVLTFAESRQCRLTSRVVNLY